MKKIVLLLLVALGIIEQINAHDKIALNSFRALQPKNIESHTRSLKKNNWKLYSYRFGSEKTKIRFPEKPDEFSEAGVFYSIAETDSNAYVLMGLKPALANAKSSVVFANYLDNMEWETVSEKYTTYNGYPVLDLVVKDGFLYNSQRIIVTKKNVYALVTSYIEDDTEQHHHYFVGSFKMGK